MGWRFRSAVKLLKNVDFKSFHGSTCFYATHGPTDIKGMSASPKNWLKRHMDPNVRMARQEDFRCRSAFKLLEIDSDYQIFKPGQVVIDCGAAPGSWTQVAVERVIKEVQETAETGMIISIDIREIQPIDGAVVLSGKDFMTTEAQTLIKKHLANKKADIILSDMSPPTTGIKSIDHEVSMKQAMAVVRFCLEVLKDGGTVVMKATESDQLNKIETNLKKCFQKIKRVKPHASRSDSSEVYILGRNFNFKTE